MPGGAEQPDVGPAVAHDGQVRERRAQDLAHHRHRLAPRAPAADPDGHAVAELGHGLGDGRALVHGASPGPGQAWPARGNIVTRRIVSLQEAPRGVSLKTKLLSPYPSLNMPDVVWAGDGRLGGAGAGAGRGLRCEGETRTRGELDRRANRLARAYAALGVRAGDLVTIALPNGCEFYEACLAVWRLGATPNPVSARLPELERRAIVETASPALVVGAPAGERYEPPLACRRASSPAPELRRRAAPRRPSPRHVRAMTSGGSTGRPKVIVDTVPAEVRPREARERHDTRAASRSCPGRSTTPGPS